MRGVDQLSGYTVLTEAPTLMQAHLTAGRLKAQGIAAHVYDDHRCDDWGMLQKINGAVRYPVLVPPKDLDGSREIVQSMSQYVAPLDDADELGGPLQAEREHTRRLRIWAILILVFPGAIVLLMASRLARLLETDRSSRPKPDPV